MTNYFKSITEDQEISGLSLILGGYCVHLLEGEHSLINKILKELNQAIHLPNSIYQSIWILHQTEEVRNIRKIFTIST
jgi:hypothetical protein